MNNQKILDNAPEGATHFDAEKDYLKFACFLWGCSWMFYDDQDDDWFMTDSKSLRSLADIKRIAELEKELLLGTKNSIATDLLNVMEKDNVENFSIQVFKVDSGLKRDLQVTCEYLDGVSVSETITNLKEQVAELEKERDELKGDVVVTYKQCGEAESKLEDIEAFFCDEDGCPAIEPFSSKGLAKWLEAHNLEQQAKVINILYKEGKCDADSLEYFKKLKEQGDD
jgi:hypothetical protein